jgi:hypothetical protein
MPDILLPGAGMPPVEPQGTVAYGAELPLKDRLRPDTTLHNKILSRLNARIQMSQRIMEQRYEAWDEVNDTLRMFVDLSRQAKRGDRTTDPKKKEMPFERAIVIPVSFAIHDLRKSQLLSLFSYRKPMLQLEGRGPEDIKAAKNMEIMLDYDLEQTNALLVLHNLLQDADRYGVGVIYDVWEEEPGWVMERPQLPPIMQRFAQMFAPALLQPQRVPGIVREFNRWTSVDPYNFWPDPRKPVADLQSGEFIGHRSYQGRLALLERSADRGGHYFNLDQLDRYAGQRGTSRNEMKRSRFSTDDFLLRGENIDDKDRGYYAIDHLQVKLIPREWELAEGDAPEIWWFAAADESLIIRTQPTAYEHGKFNYSAGEVLPDAHEVLNPGMVEEMDGLQRTIDWLYNSRIANIRRAINNSIIWSPSLFEEQDMTHPNPAGAIRLTQKGEELLLAGALPIGGMWQQLLIQDLTGSHAQMSGQLFDMAQRMSAASDPALGQPTDEKRTLGEVQSILASASQRNRIIAQLIDAQAIKPLADRAIANRQQFTSLEQYFRVVGDLAKMEETRGLERLLLNRSQIQGNFDYVPNSGILPADPARQAELWIRMLEIASGIPAVSEPGPDGKMLDLRQVFNEAVRAAGIKNVDSFYVQAPPQIMPDQQLQAGVQAGNIVPLEQAQGPPGMIS